MIVVIDDLRTFWDDLAGGLDIMYFRTEEEGLCALKEFYEDGTELTQLWLDHDLGGDDTTAKIVGWLSMVANRFGLFPVDEIVVHTSNPSAADWMVRSLKAYGYHVRQANAADYFTIEDQHATRH